MNTARKEYEQGIQDEQRSEADFKALQQELQQARKLDVRLDEVTPLVKETETRLRDVLRRQKEGEDKLQSRPDPATTKPGRDYAVKRLARTVS